MQSAKVDGHLEEDGEFLQEEEEYVSPHQGRPHGDTTEDAVPEREHKKQLLLH